MSESNNNTIIEEESKQNSWLVWCNDNTERLKLAGYVVIGLSVSSLGGYFLYKQYSSDE